MSEAAISDMRITPTWDKALREGNREIMNSDGSCPSLDVLGFTPEIQQAFKDRLVDICGLQNLPDNFSTMEAEVINTNFNHDSMEPHVDDVRVCYMYKIPVNLERHHVFLNRYMNLCPEENNTG